MPKINPRDLVGLSSIMLQIFLLINDNSGLQKRVDLPNPQNAIFKPFLGNQGKFDKLLKYIGKYQSNVPLKV